MHLFLTFTCNQKLHFGTQNIKKWLDNGDLDKHFPDFDDLPFFEKEEIVISLNQSSAGVMLRNWMEVRKLFLEYMCESSSSPFCPVDSMFARDEYQSDTGNLPHIHMMLCLKLEAELTEEQQDSLNDLVRAKILEIVRFDEAEKFI